MSITAADLASLPKLQKMHLSWPFAYDASVKTSQMFVPANKDLLTQYTRIVGSLPLSLEWATPDQLAVAQAMKIPVNITSSPFIRLRTPNPVFPADYTGAEWWQDMGDFATKLQTFAPLSGQITHFMMDVELWAKSTQNPAAMVDKYNWLYKLAKGAFPNATVFFYDRGSYEPTASTNDGWTDSLYCPSGTPSDVNCCELYYSEHTMNQEVYLKTKAASPNTPVIPCVNLGLCAHRAGSAWGVWGNGPVPDENLFIMGMELNHPWCKSMPLRFPLSDASCVYLYPEPFTGATNWGDQFVKYVKGANNISA